MPGTNPAKYDEDTQLLAEWRRGQTEALNRLVEKYQRPLFAFLARFAASPDQANEWFQETWVRALRRMNWLRAQNIAGWLFRIAHNLIRDEARRKRPDCSLEEVLPGTEQTIGATVPSPTAAPSREVADRELGQWIAAAANRLPLEQREVFWLRLAAGLTFREIARIQRVSINTALGRMQAALKKLRSDLGPIWREWKEANP